MPTHDLFLSNHCRLLKAEIINPDLFAPVRATSLTEIFEISREKGLVSDALSARLLPFRAALRLTY